MSPKKPFGAPPRLCRCSSFNDKVGQIVVAVAKKGVDPAWNFHSY